MANKALAKRQKMTIRAEPATRPLKTGGSVPPVRRQGASSQTRTLPTRPGLQERLLKMLTAERKKD